MKKTYWLATWDISKFCKVTKTKNIWQKINISKIRSLSIWKKDFNFVRLRDCKQAKDATRKICKSLSNS